MAKFVKIQHAFHHNMIHILVYATGVCNYNCEYCSFGSMRNDKFLNLNVLYNFLDNLYNLRKQKIYVELIGGEPTLDKNILLFAKKIYENGNITLGIYTNFSKPFNLYYELAKYNVDLTLTWHSLVNDFSNTQFIKNADKLLNSNINQNIDVHIMYEKDHIYESINAFNALVCKYPYNVELCLLDRDFKTNKIYFLENKYYTPNELKTYNELIAKQRYKKNKYIYKVSYDDGFEQLLTIPEVQNNSDYYNFKLWKCDAGKNYMYIDITGNIYPCQCYSNSKLYAIGNIFNNINDITFKNTVCKYDKCACVWEAYKERVFKK